MHTFAGDKMDPCLQAAGSVLSLGAQPHENLGGSLMIPLNGLVKLAELMAIDCSLVQLAVPREKLLQAVVVFLLRYEAKIRCVASATRRHIVCLRRGILA